MSGVRASRSLVTKLMKRTTAVYHWESSPLVPRGNGLIRGEMPRGVRGLVIPAATRSLSKILSQQQFIPSVAVDFCSRHGEPPRRWMSGIPENLDPQIYVALNALLADDWLQISHETKRIVEKALRSGTEEGGKEQLASAWRAAKAVEIFCDRLVDLRNMLDEASGGTGETVAKLPEGVEAALKVALERFEKYLASFSDDEIWLKKKVEVVIGGIFIQMKQRCAHLGPEWGKMSLIGTSGLSGSYIERRTALDA